MGGQRLDFEIDDRLEIGLLTAHAGVPGLIEAFRQTGAAAVIDRDVQFKQRKRGLGASEMVESLFARWAALGMTKMGCNHCTGWMWAEKAATHGVPIIKGTDAYLSYPKRSAQAEGSHAFLGNGNSVTF
jgi:hypothetical protein